MDYLHAVLEAMRRYLVAIIVAQNILALAGFYALISYTSLPLLVSLTISILASLLLASAAAWLASSWLLQPLKAIWLNVLHISPEHVSLPSPAPDPANLQLGRELVVNLLAQIHQLATVAKSAEKTVRQEGSDLHRNFIASNLPLPLVVLDGAETIVFANDVAAQYIGVASEDMIGKNFYMVFDMAFPSEDTLDIWLKNAKQHTATATASWERVRLNVRDSHPTLLFDLAAYYNRANPTHKETILVFFDHTKQYSQDDQAVSFMALSVHELRTPLTLLRGYIEVFEEELASTAAPELQDFMRKMSATAQQLTAFVNNLLNVARVDNDQLELRLQSEDWTTILRAAIDNLSLRAQVRGISLECTIADNLPAVGVDRLSIHEVINNLIDNAIKYSGASKKITVNAHLNKDGLIETTVQDYGVGIAPSIMPNLFTKFYRDHRNRAQIGGTGLGLYLSNAIVAAHGGNLWVRSKEGSGSTFGFTLLPYETIKHDSTGQGDQEIVRGAHGWIKNHSLYRR